jgi:uncharacterized protein (TIGR02611 family)
MGADTDRIRLKLANRRWDPRRVAVTLLGFAVLLVGLVLLALPGPGLLVVAIGLAILATEFMWAWRAQRYVRAKARDAGQRAWRFRAGRGGP